MRKRNKKRKGEREKGTRREREKVFKEASK